jgi:hypothetical protein
MWYVWTCICIVTCISDYRRVLDSMIGLIVTLYTVLGTTGNYSAIADLQTLQLTVPHAMGFLVFTSRILATDLSQSHYHFKSHMKSSFQSLLHFLPLFCSCKFRRLDSSLLDDYSTVLCSYYSLLLGRVFWLCPFITPGLGPHRKHSLSCLWGVFTALLPLNRRPILPRICFCENVFSESLPSHEYTRHSTRIYIKLVCVYVCMYMCLHSYIFMQTDYLQTRKVNVVHL